MGIDTLLVILLVWTIAGMLAAIAFGKAIHLASPEDEESLVSSAGTIKYFHKHIDDSRNTKTAESKSREIMSKRASG